LLERADRLAGRTLQHIAAEFGLPVPPDLRRNKGWIGQLMEAVLGATAASRAQPDFPHLGVELKTLPIDEKGGVKESTYVCTAPMDGVSGDWESSWVCQKLAHVLWVPVLAKLGLALGERRVGAPLLWQPSEEDLGMLRQDWEELTELMSRGELWMISGHRGAVLQLRPKAAKASSTNWVLDEEANWVKATPMGFYLRAKFTRGILARHFVTRSS
jgi:DNA mismatch repair protein MutH